MQLSWDARHMHTYILCRDISKSECFLSLLILQFNLSLGMPYLGKVCLLVQYFLLLSLFVLQMFGCNYLSIFFLLTDFDFSLQLDLIVSHLHLSLQVKLGQGLLIFVFLYNDFSFGQKGASVGSHRDFLLLDFKIPSHLILAYLLFQVFVQLCLLVIYLFIFKFDYVALHVDLCSEILLLDFPQLLDLHYLFFMSLQSLIHGKLIMVLLWPTTVALKVIQL